MVLNRPRFDGDHPLSSRRRLFDGKIEALGGERPEGLLPLYRRPCHLVYCFDDWKVEYSDEPPVCFGTCPQGHGRVIDMG